MHRSVGFISSSKYLQVLCSNLSTNKEGPSHSEKEWGTTKEKHGYGTNGGFEKRDREAAGLFYLNTLQLPETLQKNLDSYLKSKEKGLYLFLLLHEKEKKLEMCSGVKGLIQPELILVSAVRDYKEYCYSLLDRMLGYHRFTHPPSTSHPPPPSSFSEYLVRLLDSLLALIYTPVE